jgi:FixJ family two-component response regulator
MAQNAGPISGALIFILEDDPATAAACRESLVMHMQADARSFGTLQEMIAAPDLAKVDLFIIDNKLGGGVLGFDVPARLPLRCRFAAYLFVSGFAVSSAEMEKAAGLPYFDFLAKPFTGLYLAHRVKLLLTARLKLPEGLDDRIMELWAHAQYVALVIDAALKIKLANEQLAALLGIKTPRGLIGRLLSEYLTAESGGLFEPVRARAAAGDLSYFDEFVGDIRGADNQVHAVKWFVSPFAGGEDNGALILMVGIPGAFRQYLSDSLRQKWRASIQAHREAIEAIKKRPFKVATATPACQFD